MPDGTRRSEAVEDHAYLLFRRLKGDAAPLPDYFVDAQSLGPEDHLAVQARVQAFVDSSISKTINCPEEMAFEDSREIYTRAYELGCKGCTTYRPNEVTGAVLESASPGQAVVGGGSTGAGNGRSVQDREEILRAVRQSELPLEKPAARHEDEFEAGAVVHLTRALERPEALQGRTYKIRWPGSEHAMYITINDIVRDGRRQPFEIFINTKNPEHQAWTLALTRMMSAVFRRGGDVSFIVEELKAVFDPTGGQWFEGKYVPSILALIGMVIEDHLLAIGAVEARDDRALEVADRSGVARQGHAPKLCGRCGQPDLVYREGCEVCLACDYSKCA